MGDWFNWQVVQSVVRQVAGWSGSAMVTQGIFTQDQATLYTGAVVAVAALAFSLFSARFKKVAIDEAGGKHVVKAAIDNKSMASD